jgi:allantoin racemase
MTRLLWVNPVGTDAFDEPLRVELERAKRPDTDLEVRSLSTGPAHLEYRSYEAAVVPELLGTIVDAEREGFDAVVIGCFNDTGLEAAREVATRAAVAAPCESALHVAATLGQSFSLVGVTRKVEPLMRENVRRYGFGDRLVSAKLLGFGVDDFQTDPDETCARLAALGREAVERDGADVLLLACTITYGFAARLQAELGVPVVDPVIAPLKYGELLAELRRFGWLPSRAGGYRSPAPDELERFGLDRLAPPLPVVR